MRAKFTANRPDEIHFTLSMTMPLIEWRQLQEQLARAWPSSNLSHAITDMVWQATKSFEPKTPEGD